MPACGSKFVSRSSRKVYSFEMCIDFGTVQVVHFESS